MILKIALWILLGILLLILFLLGVVLLVPIRYRIHAEKYEAVNARFQVTWLLHLVSALFVIENGKVSLGRLKLAGITVLNFLNPKQAKAAEEAVEAAAETAAEGVETLAAEAAEDAELTDSSKGESPEAVSNTEEQPEAAVDSETLLADEEKAKESAKEKESSEKKKRKKVRKKKKKKEEQPARKKLTIKERLYQKFLAVCDIVDHGIDRIDDGIDWLYEKIVKLSDLLRSAEEILSEECTIGMIHRIGRLLKAVILHILPVRCKGRLELGLADPAATGQVCTAMAILLPVYEDHLEFTPNFAKQVTEGEITCRGRIRLGYLVRKVLGLIFNRDFLKLLGLLIRKRKEMKAAK